jgi:hypothetical protein
MEYTANTGDITQVVRYGVLGMQVNMLILIGLNYSYLGGFF